MKKKSALITSALALILSPVFAQAAVSGTNPRPQVPATSTDVATVAAAALALLLLL